MTNHHLYSFDISSHIHRCYHMCIKNGKDKQNNSYFNGQPTYMIRPLMQLIQSEINKNKETPYSHIVFVFDGDSNVNFRKEIYPQYKANRDKTPDDLVLQKRTIYSLLKHMGYPVLCIPEFEADDIIATLAKTTTKYSIKHTIFTKDKDLFALVNKYTNIYRGSQHGIYDTQRVIEDKGVAPHQINDFLTLLGDTSDNIKGVDGCGEKGAAKILSHYSIQDIIQEPPLLNNIKGITNRAKIISYFQNNAETIRLMQKLIRMKDDIALNIKLSDLKQQEPNREKVKHIERMIGFSQAKPIKKTKLN